MKCPVAILLLLKFLQLAQAGDFSSTLGHIKPQASPAEQAAAVNALIHRIIPEKSDFFQIKIDSSTANEGIDSFQLLKLSNGSVQITGSSGVAAATGFNHYLKYYCKCHISWEASQLSLPDPLPNVNTTISLNDRFRYYQNVCTTSYSFVWWNWPDWQRHIDWMALNAFNLVLAFNAQEAIWERVYKNFNLTDDEIRGHFTGPAFLAWLRMGNMRGFGGSLSPAWHRNEIFLQKKILERMRSFGIIPVLPAFAGHLPRGFRQLYPDANMVQVGTWNRFNDTYCCPYFLDPNEQLFNEIGRAFMTEQIAEFGTDHVYNCDSFNENEPSSSNLTYLHNVGQSIFRAMTDVDPNAVWVMQSWLFVNEMAYWTPDRAKALLTSVPKGRMIVLDLQSEQSPQYDRLEQYYGQPYIWCMLHNFGGTLGLFGSSNIINERPYSARNAPGSTMIGTGLTPEGINQNYVIYDLMMEHAWRENATDLVKWVEKYAERRYGISDENANHAWSILINTVYNYQGLIKNHGKYVINRSPRLKIVTWTWYAESDLLSAWDYLLKASDNIGNNPGYYHDLVDVTRQVLQVKGDTYYRNLLLAYEKGDLVTFLQYSATFVDIFDDLEKMLATNEAFLLGRWVQSAKNAANSSEEEKQFGYNARNQISLWGSQGEIMDYASKQWAGAVSHLFAPRWRMFIIYLADILSTGASYNNTYIRNKIFTQVEEPFTLNDIEFPTEPSGDPVEVASKIHEKWTQKRAQDKKFLNTL